ncbi:MAG: hypothetical protein V1689_05780, partial [Pseudomonadota bacterium]
FDKTKDVYPHVNRLYVDIMDVSHSDIQGEVENISEFIYSRLKDRLREIPLMIPLGLRNQSPSVHSR